MIDLKPDERKYRLVKLQTDALEEQQHEAHDKWEDAAKDAEKLGVGRWTTLHEFKLDWPYQIQAVRP